MYNVIYYGASLFATCLMHLKLAKMKKKCDGEPEALRIPDMSIMFNELKYLSSSYYLSIYVFMLELVN